MAGVQPGMRVRHAKHGEGVVARLVSGGRKCLVRFDRSPMVPHVVPLAALELEEPSETVGAPVEIVLPEPPAEALPAETPVKGSISPQVLEALRLGVVPSTGISALTVGRHEELARLEGLLDRRRGLLVVSGGYGAGKSHLIEMAEAEARERRFLVARCTFDPVEVPPSHPLRMLAALMRAMVYPDGPGSGLRPLLERLDADESHLSGDRAHRWLSAALFAVHRAPEFAEETLGFVEGRLRTDHVGLWRALRRAGYQGPKLLGLPDYRTFGQIMAHILGGVSVWARDAGWAGLAVLMDEAEYVDRLDRASRDMAENVIRHLALATLSEEELKFSPDEVYRGGQGVHRAISPCFEVDQPLVAVCAFTPNPEVEQVLARTVERSCTMDLEPIRPSLLPVLADKVYGLVKMVHPRLDPLPEHRRRVQDVLGYAFESGQVETTRQAARLVVEFWDLYRVDPRRALAALVGGR